MQLGLAHQSGFGNKMTLDMIRDDFELLDEWEDRYRYVIELGRSLEPLDDAFKTDATKVRGCASQVWLMSRPTTDPASPERVQLHFTGDSDAHIVRGLIAILLAFYNDRTPEDIIAAAPEAMFEELGLIEHLTPQRANGLTAMVQRIRADAKAALANKAEP